LSIKIKDIDFANREIPIIGKGKIPRTLLFHEKSVYWIRKYLEKRKDSNEHLFVNRAGDNKWSYNDACRSFQRYKRLSGISKDFSIHTFRHTFATQLLFNGAKINEVSFLLGHKDLQTTMKYYIGVLNKAEIKERITDKHFDFIPESALNVAKLVATQ
jgi:site-specific recombinase XerD